MARTADRVDSGPARPLTLQPVHFREACAFVRAHHRHLPPAQGWVFGLAVHDGEQVIGVVMVGRPVARHLDDGLTLEVTRCCVLAPNAASKLYAAAWRAARALGYRRLVSYTLAAEPGTSLRAAGWQVVGQTRGGQWDTPGRARKPVAQPGQKTLWEAARSPEHPVAQRCTSGEAANIMTKYNQSKALQPKK